jgi:ankyrin repeat protein
MSFHSIVNGDNLLDTAAGMEKGAEKIDIPALKKTNLKLKLWGTITGNGVRAYAIIEEGTKLEQKLYQVGENIQNATIKMILRDKVVLSVEGNDELLVIETKRVDVNAKNQYGVTTLIDASYQGRKEQVEWLIVGGADLNARDNQGDTALMNAAIKGHSEIVALLLAHGADVHAKDNAGSTALIEASKYGRESSSEVLSLLIENGAEVNEKNKYGETALMNAARWGHKENVRFLIDEGADINAMTKSGETALEFAAYSLHKDVVELLKSHGARE